VQAATGIPAILVLLVVMNWFFHRMYRTGWIAHHHKRRRSLLGSAGSTDLRRLMLGFALLGFTWCIERVRGRAVPADPARAFRLECRARGVTLGLLATAAVGVLTFGLHRRLPYRRLLVITGAMLCLVLLVMVGEQVNEMQLAGWIGTTPIGVQLPGWMGTWFSIFPNVETIVAQTGALALVLGSYFLSQHLRVRRPRRQGLPAAAPAQAPPEPAAAANALG
jgi:high-affinity iron transporter